MRKEKSLNVFTETKVYLEYCEGIVSDIDPYAQFEIGAEMGVSFTWTKLSEEAARAHAYSANCLCRWESAVWLYSPRQLSHESDKLVAIAGLAR